MSTAILVLEYGQIVKAVRSLNVHGIFTKIDSEKKNKEASHSTLIHLEIKNVSRMQEFESRR